MDQPTEKTLATPPPTELLEQIVPDPEQPRTTFPPGPLAELAQNIWDHGLTQPIVVTPEDGVFRIFVGERRWRAFRLNQEKANSLLEADPKLPADHPARAYETWTRIPVSYEAAMAADVRLLRQVGENDQRSGLTLYERAYAYYRAHKSSGVKAKEFCARHHIAQTLMSTYTTLVNAKGATKIALESGLFQDAEAARVFLQLPLPLQESLIAEAQDNETLLTRIPLQKALEEINLAAEAQEKAAAAAAAAAKAAEAAAAQGGSGSAAGPGGDGSGPPGDGSRGSSAGNGANGADGGNGGNGAGTGAAAGGASSGPYLPAAAAGPVLFSSTLYWLQHHLETLAVPEDDEPHRLQALGALTDALLHESPLLLIRESVEGLVLGKGGEDEADPESGLGEASHEEQPQA
jgi:ParB-like chromosome segregation protein Spo0J